MTSRKDYVAIATALAESGATREVVVAIADVLAADNPRFDRDRFCGYFAFLTAEVK